MGPVEVTTIAALIITILTSLVVPWWLRRRQGTEDIDETGLRSWQSVTHILQEERDDLKRQIVANEDQYRLQRRALESDCNKQLGLAKRRITELETEVSELHARLGRGGNSTAPKP